MDKRIKNPPQYWETRGLPKKRKKKRRRTSEQVRLAKNVKRRKYNEHAKELRDSHLFGELFNAKNGVDFRKSPDSWPAATKTRITKYWEEMAPRLSGDYVVKRYYKKGRLAVAAEAALQGKLLKGQKAVAFSVDKNQKLEVTFNRKGKIFVKKGGINEDKIFFNMTEFVKDPIAELQAALDTTDSTVFKLITGNNESSSGYTRSALITQVERWVLDYAEDDPEAGIAKYDKWLFGLIEYPNIKTTKRIERRTIKHEQQVSTRQKKRLAERARDERAMTKAEKRSIKLTGRKGRVK